MDKIPVYLQKYFESGIVYVNDFLFNLSSNDSFDYFAKKKIYTWLFKGGYTSPPLTSPSFLIYNNTFDVTKKKSKDYYSLLVSSSSLFRKKHDDFPFFTFWQNLFVVYCVASLRGNSMNIFWTHILSWLDSSVDRALYWYLQRSWVWILLKGEFFRL